MTRSFKSVWCSGSCRRAGWYVQDLRRGLKDIFIGGRHCTAIEAQTEARRLEVELKQLQPTTR